MLPVAVMQPVEKGEEVEDAERWDQMKVDFPHETTFVDVDWRRRAETFLGDVNILGVYCWSLSIVR